MHHSPLPTTAPLDLKASKPVGMFFQKLIRSPEFTEFAVILKQLTGLSMALNTPDVGTIQHGISSDGGNPLCAMIRGTSEGARRCEGCDRRYHALAASKGKAKLYTCHAGFLDMAIPIIVQGQHGATISSGQVLSERPSDEAFKIVEVHLHHAGVCQHLSRRGCGAGYVKAG